LELNYAVLPYVTKLKVIFGYNATGLFTVSLDFFTPAHKFVNNHCDVTVDIRVS